MGWSEAEVRAAVTSYFDLLETQQQGIATNKAALYRVLSDQFPNRSAKAFERKFQNISAILYEQRLPYCSGLKPLFNYQRLLRLIVLDHLDRSPLPQIEPQEILFSKLRELNERGPIVVKEKGSGRYGLALEHALGIPKNSSKAPDFMGIELKTKSGSTLQTLFSRTPSYYANGNTKHSFFDQNAYHDPKKDRKALYTSFGNRRDSLGFSLRVADLSVQVLREERRVLEYDAERLEEALFTKHMNTAFVSLTSKKTADIETCSLKEVTYCKHPSIIRFLRLVRQGHIHLDFTLSQKPNGQVKDHGFLWRIQPAVLDQLYLSTKVVPL